MSIISRINLSESRINKVPYTISSKDIQLLGSINGLVCIACVSELENYFVLWNPIIRRFKKFFAPELFLKHLELFGYGWDAVLDDYKLIVKPLDSIACVVYSIKTDSRSEIRISNYFLNLLPFSTRTTPKTPSTIVKGCPYWSWVNQWILKFEVESNEFKFFEIPNYVGQSFGLVNLNDSLARVEYGGECHRHVRRLDEERRVWIKMYTIDISRPSFYTPSMCFMYGGEIVLDRKKDLYDHKSKTIKRIAYDEQGHFINGFSYTPTLVLIEGMKALHGQDPRRSLSAS